MMIRKFCLAFAVWMVFGMHGLANAAQWMYIQRLEGTRYGPCHEFIDADSVWQDGDSLYYWSLWLMEQPSGPDRIRKILRKNEIQHKPLVQVRSLETVQYADEEREIRRYQQPGAWSEYRQDALRVRHYLDETRREAPKNPDSLAVFLPSWHDAEIETAEFRLWVDVRSIQSVRKVAAGQVPDEFEMTVKKVWTDLGAADRSDRLNEEKPAPHRYQSLSYSILTYRFRTDEDRGMLLWQSDHDERGIPLAFWGGNAWQPILREQAEVRALGLQVFRGRLGVR